MSGELIERQRYAEALAQSQLLPAAYVKQPANVLVAMEYGAALGLPPIQAINSVNVIQGKPSMSADLMAALVRRAGCKLRITQKGEGAQATVTASLVRPDDPEFTFTATWNGAKAERAGVWNSANWRKYPEQMMRARAISEVCRAGANDYLMGISYVPEELGDGAGSSVNPASSPVSRPQSDAEPLGVGEVGVASVEIETTETGDATPTGVPPISEGVASPPEQVVAAGRGEESVPRSGSGTSAAATTTITEAEAEAEAWARVYETAGMLDYSDERLAKGCEWASQGRTSEVEELTVAEAEALVSQLVKNETAGETVEGAGDE